MSEKMKLMDEELENVNGGRITWTWNGTTGSLGINGNNPYTLLDYDAFEEYYLQIRGTMSDTKIINALVKKGIIKAPGT